MKMKKPLDLDAIDRIIFAYRQARSRMWNAWLTQYNALGLTSACNACGSNYCCYQLPLSHPMEGVAAALRLYRQKRIPLINKAEEQGRAQHDLWSQDFDVLSRCSSMEEAAKVAGTGAEKWYERKEPCVFLHPRTGRCEIYDVRPTMCATYYVRDRCTRFVGATELVPTADNTEVVAAVMDLSDLTLSTLTGSRGRAAPLPFAYAVALGAMLLDGRGAHIQAQATKEEAHAEAEEGTLHPR